MAARYELELTISSAKNLKNINWRHGPLKPYAVVWVEPQKNKFSTPVDEDGDESPVWDQKFLIPLKDPIEDSTLCIDIVHANAAEDTKPLIGSAKLKLKDIVDGVGIGERFADTLKLKRPSGRPHGKVEVKAYVKEPRYRAPDPYDAPPYGVPPPQYSSAPPPYGVPPPHYSSAPPPYGVPPPQYSSAPPPYGAPPPQYSSAPPPYGAPPPPYSTAQPPYGGSYPYAAPPSGYLHSSYGAGGQTYGQAAYGGQTTSYGEQKKSKYGLGTGLAVGAVAGVLGGLAIHEGVEHIENKIAEDVAEKVEEDLGFDVYDEY